MGDIIDSAKKEGHKAGADIDRESQLSLNSPMVRDPEILPMRKAQFVELMSFAQVFLFNRVYQLAEPNGILRKVKDLISVIKLVEGAVVGPSPPHLSGNS